MESETLKSIHWKLTSNDIAVSKQKGKQLPTVPPKTLNIRNRFHFSSSLARMSVIVSIDHEKDRNNVAPMLVLTKVWPIHVPSNIEREPLRLFKSIWLLFRLGTKILIFSMPNKESVFLLLPTDLSSEMYLYACVKF